MKKILMFITIVLSSFGFTLNVVASSYNVSVTSKTVTVGSTITLKITGNDVTGAFDVTSSNSSVLAVSGGTKWIENNSESITLTAKKVGTAVIKITPNEGISNSNAEIIDLDVKSITITVKEKPTSNSGTTNKNNESSSSNSGSTSKAKSSNNYLSSLTVDGFFLNEDFNKETLEYSVTLPSDTEEIKINAQLADSSAKAIGTGVVKVSEGINNFEIIVTAENGSKRTYKLNATVEEVKAIKVNVNNNEYTLVRKRKDLPKISEYFAEKDITIDGEVLPGYYSEILKYTLVGLKDKNGIINYYIYKNGKYTLYKEYNFGGAVLQILDKNISSGYKKSAFTYDGDRIEGYQEEKIDILKNTYALDNESVSGNQFYLFYAKNVETGKESLYQYDSLEKTVQRYNQDVIDMYRNASDTYYMYLLGTILLLGVVVIIFSIILISKGKKKKKENKKYVLEKEENVSKISDEEEEILDNSSLEEDIPIKKSSKSKKKKK